MKIVVATSNENKIREIRESLNESGIEIISMHDAGIDADIEETGTSFEENALIKARFVAKITGEAAMADDSGLQVDHLGGQPGIYSARFGGENTPYDIKNKMILEKMLGVSSENRSARFVCSIAAVFPDGEELIVTRTVEGFITEEPKGENGFGYDPIFFVPGFDMTLAQMDIKLKNRISHRGKALTDMSDALISKLKKV